MILRPGFDDCNHVQGEPKSEDKALIFGFSLSRSVGNLFFHLSVISSFCSNTSLFVSRFNYSITFKLSFKNRNHNTNKSKVDLRNFNFVTAGDFGCGKNANKTTNNMLSKQPEIVLTLGDLSYKKSAECWFNLFSELRKANRTRIAIGDNEMYPAKFIEYIRHFNMTKPYYSFDYGNVHFLAKATAKNKEIPYVEGSDQFNFVKNDLKKVHDNKDIDWNIDWIIVYQFRAFYSSNTIHPGLDELQMLSIPYFPTMGWTWYFRLIIITISEHIQYFTTRPSHLLP